MPRTSKPAGVRNHPVERAINKPKTEKTPLLVPSGSVMLNLACSNTWRGAYPVGRMVNLIGDSNSGKTYLALEMMAQCCQNPRFDDYELIYDDTEHALSMNIRELFGRKLADRITGPDGPLHTTDSSRTIEDFHFNVKDALKMGPCIYVLDSFDALSSEQDLDKIEEMRKAREAGKEIAGSYNLAKPKKASQILQDIVCDIEKTNSFLLIISQTRENLTPGSFEKKTRSGGKALKFYASHEIWLAVTGRLRKAVNGKSRVIGSELKAKVSKNKLTGTFREVDFDFRQGYGCDDISSCIDFLKGEGVIKGSANSLSWRDYSLSLSKLIQTIEDKNIEPQLFKDAQEAWVEVEEKLKPTRKSKYED